MAVESAVVLSDYCYAQGGASRVAIDEAIALHSYGIEVTFLGAVGPVSDEMQEAGLRTICLQQPELADVHRRPLVALETLWNLLAYRATHSLLSALDWRRTVVHLHGYTKALTTTPALAARRAGFATICTLHDFYAACPNGAFYDYHRQEPCRLRALSLACATTSCDKRHPLHKVYRLTRGVAQRHLARFPASVRDYISLSRQSEELVRPYLPTDACFHRLANIINIVQAPPVDVAANDSLLFVGRLDVEKGADLAAAAARYAGMPIRFVGDGPLRAAIEAVGLPVTGWLSADGVRQQLERARCLIFPSRWYETYGLVIDEAAARGVPAIVSDVSAPAERIVDGLTGWVFRSNDVDNLARCMRLAHENSTIRAAGAEAYRRYWTTPSDPASHARALAAIYDVVIANRGAAA
jgi:glycosyltransferase involved in cell wall biosynthesis